MNTNASIQPEYWIDQWHALTARNTAYCGYGSTHTWNRMADGYGRTEENETDKRKARTAETLAFIERGGFSLKGCRVLDIGCGPGTYAFAFAEKGAQVVCLDSAEKMIDRLRAETPKFLHKRITPLCADWHTLDLKKHGFNRAFDLVFANMTPAVNGPDTFLKLMDASRQLCWFQSWAGRRENPLLEELYKKICKMEPSEFSGSFMIAFNLVYTLGFFPACSFRSTSWTRKTALSEAIEFYSTFFQSENDRSLVNLRKEIARLLEKRARNGYIEYTAGGHTGAMLWNIES